MHRSRKLVTAARKKVHSALLSISVDPTPRYGKGATAGVLLSGFQFQFAETSKGGEEASLHAL